MPGTAPLPPGNSSELNPWVLLYTLGIHVCGHSCDSRHAIGCRGDDLEAGRCVIGEDIINAIRRNAGASSITASARSASASLVRDWKGPWEKEFPPSAESGFVDAVDDCVNKTLGNDTGLSVEVSIT